MSKRRLPKPGTIEIAPSILSADFADLAGEVRQVASAGVRMIHLDIMDGHFVPNITIGPVVIASLRKHSSAVFDAHLMIDKPEKYAEDFIKAGADHITFHIETVSDPVQFISYLRGLGVTVGVTLNPETPVDSIENVASLCDMILVMTVHPGFAGQEFIASAAEKCRHVRRMVGSDIRIEVDGGINASTAGQVVAYGADTLVAGHAIFSEADRIAAIEAIRAACR